MLVTHIVAIYSFCGDEDHYTTAEGRVSTMRHSNIISRRYRVLSVPLSRHALYCNPIYTYKYKRFLTI